MTEQIITRKQIVSYFGLKSNANFSENEFSYMTVFCLIDDLVKKYQYKDHHHCQFYLTDIIMVIYIGVVDTNINYAKAIKVYETVANKKISTSRFSHLITQHRDKIINIFKHFMQLMTYCADKILIMDSFPVEVGKIYRQSQLKLIHEMESFKGFNASKKSYFIGFKIMLLVNSTGDLVCFSIDMPNVHDLTIARNLLPQLANDLEGKKIFLDKGFIFTQPEKQAYQQELGITLIHGKKIYKKQTPQEQKEIKKFNLNLSKNRKYIETINALILNKLGRKIHATNLTGFIFKLQMLVFCFQVEKEFNHQQKFA